MTRKCCQKKRRQTIAKPSAKKREGLSRVFDGSERKSTKGCVMHGVSIHQQPVVMDLHNAERKTLNQTKLDIVAGVGKTVVFLGY